MAEFNSIRERIIKDDYIMSKLLGVCKILILI